MSAKPPFNGQCLCGSIRYEVDVIQPRMGHCHCSMCRKFHGAAFATFGEAKSADFRWIAGEALLKGYIADNGSTRQFCQDCGSSMTFSPANNAEGLVEFALGTLDSDIPGKPDAHIFANFKASWFDISDQLPMFGSEREEKDAE